MPTTHTLFYKQHFHKQCQIEIGKNQAKAKQNLETELLLFENYSLSSSKLSSKNSRKHSEKYTKNKYGYFVQILLCTFF